MHLISQVAAALGPQGPVANAMPGFRSREGQLAMAAAVASTMEQGGVLAVEAATGIGKTFAYLVPALLSDRRVLLSTATKALQDQLYGRDIPRLMQTLGVAKRVAILKGRSSYLCWHRMGRARQDAMRLSDRDTHQLAQVELWALATRTGDTAELPDLEDHSPLLPWITSTRDNCLGAQCADFARCHVVQARREAMASDVVVVNHHLFFADLQVRESGIAELLPSMQAVVFDEAHQLNEIGVQFMGRQVSSGQVVSLGRDIGNSVHMYARGLVDVAGIQHNLSSSVDALTRLCAQGHVGVRLRWGELAPVGCDLERWAQGLGQLIRQIAMAGAALSTVEQASPELRLLRERAEALAENWAHFAKASDTGSVRWLDITGGLRISESPISIAEAMAAKVKDAKGGGNKAWVFTSATLGHDVGLGWFLESCGLQGALTLQLTSPFDYATQSSLYVPEDFPLPSSSGHTYSVAELSAHGAKSLQGSTMVLTTTLRAMRGIGDHLRAMLGSESGLTVLVQGEASKRTLVDRFCSLKDGKNHCILVASASFWEGIDIPGSALQLLVIDKLPFAPPDDPVVEARALVLEQQGRKAFKHLHLPQAAVTLKQGVGRLIRQESDRGVVVLCDSRASQKGYGQQLLKALPPMRRVNGAAAFDQALTELTKPSTKGLG